MRREEEKEEGAVILSIVEMSSGGRMSPSPWE